MSKSKNNNIPTSSTFLILRDNEVILVEKFKSKIDGEVKSSESTIMEVPLMYPTERNQLNHFLKVLSERRTEYIVYAVSRYFNKIRRTFLRDLAKLSAVVGDLVTTQEVEDENGKRAVYVYKAPLLDEVLPKQEAKPKVKGE